MTGQLSRRRLLVLAATSAAAAACAPAASSPTPRPTSTASSRPSSPLAANPALGIWPDVYRGAPLAVREAYDYAVTAGGAQNLSYIPCYCGCVASGHASNGDCYVREFSSGGWLVLDTHGFG